MTGLIQASVLAHQGGWDEVLILLAPLLVFVLLRVVSSRRQRNADPGQASPTSPQDSPGADSS